MISKISRLGFAFILTFPLAFTAGNAVLAADNCVVKGKTLTEARDTFAAQCTVKRIDCDPFNGEWYCASFRMTSSIAPSLTTPSGDSISQPPVVLQPEPQPQPPVVQQPEPQPPVVQQPEPQPPVSQQPEPQPPVVQPPPQPAQPNNSPTMADITDLILVTGQSNALGAGTSYDASLDNPNAKVFAFTNQGWQVASLKQIWDRNWYPRNDPNTDPSNNFAFHFGKQAATNSQSKVIGFVLVSNPGAPIKEWEYGSSFYNSVQAKALDALNQLPHKSAYDGILWHQGESDAEDKQYYTDALYTLIFNLRNESWVNDRAPFICGETKIRSVNNRLNGLNRDSDPNTACVAAEDLSTSADNRHFDAPALRTLGARYAESYLKLKP